MHGRRKLLSFAVKFVICFALLSLAWGLFAPGYNRLVIGAVNRITLLLEEPPISTLRMVGDNVGVYLYQEPGKLAWGYSGYGLHYGLVLLLSLLLATPNVKPLKRVELILIGLGLLFLVHLVALIVRVRLAYVYYHVVPGSTKTFLFNWINVFFIIGERLFPVLIWSGLSLGYLFPKRDVKRSRANRQLALR